MYFEISQLEGNTFPVPKLDFKQIKIYVKNSNRRFPFFLHEEDLKNYELVKLTFECEVDFNIPDDLKLQVKLENFRVYKFENLDLKIQISSGNCFY